MPKSRGYYARWKCLNLASDAVVLHCVAVCFRFISEMVWILSGKGEANAW